MVPGILPETTVGKHNLPCHLQMPTKFLSCKKGAKCEHGPEALSCSVGPSLIYNGLFQSGKVFCGQMSPNLTFLLEITGSVSSGLKRRETSSVSSAFSSKASLSDGMGVHGGAYGIWASLLVLEGTMNAERYIQGFRATYAPLPITSISWKALCISAGQCKTTYCFIVEESVCWIDLLASLKWKICQRRPQTLQQLETYNRQEWDQNPKPKLQKLITSMPRRLQTVLKRRGDATPW